MCTLCLSDMGELRDEWLREKAVPAMPVPLLPLASADPVLQPEPETETETA